MSRKLIVFRHGERVDFSFGENWLETSFDSGGNFTQNPALDLPPTNLLRREGMPESYRNDCPLTQTGVGEGRSAGMNLVNLNYLSSSTPSSNLTVYVSPSLRSIQTATAIIEGIKQVSSKTSASLMRVEPCLFEWAGFYASHKRVPQFTRVDELIEANYKIDPAYQPFLTVESMDVRESVEQYYDRSHNFIKTVLTQTENDILLVGHSATPDAITRQLCGKPPLKNLQQMLEELWHVPYAGFAVAEQEKIMAQNIGKWIITKET